MYLTFFPFKTLDGKKIPIKERKKKELIENFARLCNLTKTSS